MTDAKGSTTAGLVLVGAAFIGIIAVAVFAPKTQDASLVATASGASKRRLGEGQLPIDTSPLIAIDPRDHIASPFSEPASDSIAGRCRATVVEQIVVTGGDTSGVDIVERYGVRPPPGRGPDSLIVEGSAPGSDTTRALWHCAATRFPSGEVATLVAVIENGWPGAGPSFETAHAINLAAEDACLQKAKLIFREYVFRGIRRSRVSDTLHVSGEAIPLNTEDLAADFHCTSVVRENRVVASSARLGR